MITEKLGFNVRVVSDFSGLAENFQALAENKIDAQLETWDINTEPYKKYVETEKKVKNLGALGVIGRIGWYTPKYMVDRNSEYATWRAFSDPGLSKPYSTVQSPGDLGMFWSGEKDWTNIDEKFIKFKSLNLHVRQIHLTHPVASDCVNS